MLGAICIGIQNKHDNFSKDFFKTPPSPNTRPSQPCTNPDCADRDGMDIIGHEDGTKTGICSSCGFSCKVTP